MRESPFQDAHGWDRKPSDPALSVLRGCPRSGLLQFGLGASFFELRLHRFSVGFRDAFLDLATGFGEIFGFFQAQTGDFAHDLDHVDLVRAGVGQDDVEFGLLFGRSSSCCSRWCASEK